MSQIPDKAQLKGGKVSLLNLSFWNLNIITSFLFPFPLQPLPQNHPPLFFL